MQDSSIITIFLKPPMGAEASKSSKRPELSNLSEEQIRKATEELKKRAGGKDFVNKQQFEVECCEFRSFSKRRLLICSCKKMMEDV